MAALRREHVHLPRILVELDAGRRGDRLALVDERVHEVAEVARLVELRRSGGRGGRPVSAATAFTVALKISFDHCAGRRSSNASAFSPDDSISAATRARVVRRRAADGPIHVAVSRTYSTCVSPWRVPLMNVTAESSGQAPCAPTISSAPSPFCTVITVAAGEVARRARARARRVAALAGDDHELRLG